ncbi:alpha/beta fold hydrolase [Kutzneria sp. CA-103260]|uniref:alpha/beta fold hydrolase n=1 Tax=Kutzneria sp. CA-103260 TaxID=2802641 RepID=UPI001BED7927|nr:alpha/beta hydrolase [Kutzneria sp. CA-103260]QUQ72414.1 hydrolase [Kutzneria sp. CA-103260]
MTDSPKVLVNGVPVTPAVWGPLVAELATRGYDDVWLLAPPAFGSAVPSGFIPSIEQYRAWLITELEKFGQPVDLVGHDFGGGHVVGVAIERPDLIRSWASDILGMLNAEYEWHEAAKVWQTPDAGEQMLADLFGGSAAQRSTNMQAMGMPASGAAQVAAAQGPAMAEAILQLYRSSAQPRLAEVGNQLPDASKRPGLAIRATADGFVGTSEQVERSAARAGARTGRLEGLGHWWMLQDPSASADLLEKFWRDCDEGS